MECKLADVNTIDILIFWKIQCAHCGSVDMSLLVSRFVESQFLSIHRILNLNVFFNLLNFIMTLFNLIIATADQKLYNRIIFNLITDYLINHIFIDVYIKNYKWKKLENNKLVLAFCFSNLKVLKRLEHWWLHCFSATLQILSALHSLLQFTFQGIFYRAILIEMSFRIFYHFFGAYEYMLSMLNKFHLFFVELTKKWDNTDSFSSRATLSIVRLISKLILSFHFKKFLYQIFNIFMYWITLLYIHLIKLYLINPLKC